ncbi:MAG: hypothetical protein OEV44_09755 [Spirochaetota bacterium]|nr:hypothetical protein [Spirochaetota bacterium]
MLANYYKYFVLVHIITASAFVMTMIIMQLVVTNMMKRIPSSDGKQAASTFVQTRWIPIVDIIIVLVGVTAVFIAIINWEMIIHSTMLIVKIIFGVLALSAAYSNHFIFRYLKKYLSRTNNNPGLLNKINYLMPILNKVALICGAIAVILGFIRNHISI